MKFFAFRDSKSKKIWAITRKDELEEDVTYNTQYVGAPKQVLVSVVKMNGKEQNRVIIGNKFIQISGWNPLTEGTWHSDYYVVHNNALVPREMVEGNKKECTVNQLIEAMGLQMVMETMIKTGHIQGFSKEIEENIDSEKMQKKIEEEYGTKLIDLVVDKPSVEINFEKNYVLSQYANKLIFEIEHFEKVCEQIGKETSAKSFSDILKTREEKEKRAREIAAELKGLSQQLGKEPKDFLREK